MSEQEQLESLFKRYDGKKLPRLLAPLAFRRAEGLAVLLAGSLNGQVRVVGGRFHAGQYELLDFDNQSTSYQTIQELEGALSRSLESLAQDRLDIFVPKSTRF